MQCSSSCQKNKQLFQEEGVGRQIPQQQPRALFPQPRETGCLSGLLTQVHKLRQNQGSGSVLLLSHHEEKLQDQTRLGVTRQEATILHTPPTPEKTGGHVECKQPQGMPPRNRQWRGVRAGPGHRQVSGQGTLMSCLMLVLR